MVDRSVRVRLEADISDFVSDIGVKAVAAVKKLEGAATKADVTLKKTATGGKALGDEVAAGTKRASDELGKLADTADKAMSTAGAKARKTASSEFAKAGAEASESFDKETKKRFPKSGDESGKSFGSGFKKWLRGEGGGLFAEIGKSGGSVFGSGFLGALKTPVLGPLLIAALTAAVAVALPAVGAIAASGLVAGFGAGLAGLGILFAAKSEAVGKKWQTTLAGMGADMRLFSKPYEATLIHAADVADRVFGKFKPSLQAAFKETAPVVSEFVDEVGAALEELQPAVRPLSEAFQAVLRSLGPAMQSALRNVSQGLQDLAESVEKNPDGLADLVDGMGRLTKNGLDLVTQLNNINGAFERFTGGLSLVDLALGDANSNIGKFVGFVKDSINPLSGVTKGLGLFKGSSDKANESVAITAETTQLWTQGLSAAELAAMGVGAAADGTAPKVETLGTKFERQALATQKSNDALFRNSGLLLTLSGASIGYEEAVDRATASVKENGKNLDISTEKGRNNQRALDDLVASTNSKVEAQRNSNQGEVVAARTMEAGKKSWIDHAVQMGKNRKVAEGLADDLFKIPNVTRTAKLNANKKDLEDKIAAAKKELDNPKGVTKARSAKLKADIKNAQDGIAEVNRLLNGLPPSRTVNVTVNTYRNMIETTIDRGLVASGKGVPKADGGFHPGGFPSYADGKLPSQAMVAAGKGAGLVQWAEQETGGEAFIPLAPSKRDRSTQILGQVANEFGMGLVQSFADGTRNRQEFITAPTADPNRYVGSLAGGGGAAPRVVREIHNHQHITFNGTSMDEADLIAQRANAKAELMNRGY
ncbi:hypothetical protein ACFPJ1_40730 [Kribbella qitaiheensis]|uniref:hypothetical protein n=1 Tax=Kribbella qitaiheensis TaxID=1544730 RepID=UPI00360827FA